METSLHRQLKSLYADDTAQLEVPVDGYRIDVVAREELVEIQHGCLSAIRDKVRRLLAGHRVVVVKPIVCRKRLFKRDRPEGRVIDRRFSPKRCGILDLFHEMIYFTRVFPHENLRLEVPLVEIEEWRFPGHGRRRRWRRDDFQVEDQKLVQIDRTYEFRTAADLAALIPKGLPRPFHTGHLARALATDRWFAQRVAYCLRETGAIILVGKQANTRLYQFESKRRGEKRRAA